MLAGVGIVDEWIALGAMDQLEMFCAGLAKYRFWRHVVKGEGCGLHNGVLHG